MKLLKYIKYKITEPDLDRQANVRFVHQKPRHYNLGDDLCSPKHYFEFRASLGVVNILGGGVQSNFYLDKSKFLRLDPERTILWGVGQSVKGDCRPGKIPRLPYRFWGLRDGDSVREENFLPCVSCLHPMLDVPEIDDTQVLLFVNFDPQITTGAVRARISELFPKVRVLYNNCSWQEFSDALRETSHIVTNSFHGSYWGLLSGRHVSLIGYSSKFFSLIRMLGLDPGRVIKVERGGEQDLVDGICLAMRESHYQRLENARSCRDRFRMINLDFAGRLAGSELFSSVVRRDLK